MCRHVMNAQAFIQASCCGRWFDCFECHDEMTDHLFQHERVLRLKCKLCSRVFQRDMTSLMESDKFCDNQNCKNKWCIKGITPESTIHKETRQIIDDALEALLKQTEKMS